MPACRVFTGPRPGEPSSLVIACIASGGHTQRVGGEAQGLCLEWGRRQPSPPALPTPFHQQGSRAGSTDFGPRAPLGSLHSAIRWRSHGRLRGRGLSLESVAALARCGDSFCPPAGVLRAQLCAPGPCSPGALLLLSCPAYRPSVFSLRPLLRSSTSFAPGRWRGLRVQGDRGGLSSAALRGPDRGPSAEMCLPYVWGPWAALHNG